MSEPKARTARALSRQPSRLVLALTFVVSVALVAWGGYALYGNIMSPVPVLAGERELLRARAFSLPDLDGKTCTLAQFLGDKPILLEFMDLACPHCLEMAPILTRLHAVYGTRVQFLTVAFESRNDRRRVRQFAEHHKHPWLYLMGNMDVGRAYRVEGVPSFFLIGPDGRIREFLEGSTSYEVLSHALEAALGGP